MEKLLDRFFNYVAFDAQSKVSTRHISRDERKLKLFQELEKEMIALGFEQVALDQNGCLTGSKPSNVSWHVPAIGFISHIDVLSDYPTKQGALQVVENYQGGDIALGIGDEELSPVRFPVLHQMLGQTLITTDGKSLIGIASKAGIAEIFTAIEQLEQQNISHGDIRVAFILHKAGNQGVDLFKVESFNVEWAYTLDNGEIGTLSYENFNLTSAVVKIRGSKAPLGKAKGVMINALTLAMRFYQAVPVDETPEKTEGYGGFYHLESLKGDVEQVEMHFVLCDFEQRALEARKRYLLTCVQSINSELPTYCKIVIHFEDHYYNMRDKLMQYPQTVLLAQQAIRDCGIEPNILPVRGGTNGAKLVYMGLPCVNLFVGGYNLQSKHEFLSVEEMEKVVAIIIRIATLTAEYRK